MQTTQPGPPTPLYATASNSKSECRNSKQARRTEAQIRNGPKPATCSGGFQTCPNTLDPELASDFRLGVRISKHVGWVLNPRVLGEPSLRSPPGAQNRQLIVDSQRASGMQCCLNPSSSTLSTPIHLPMFPFTPSLPPTSMKCVGWVLNPCAQMLSATETTGMRTEGKRVKA
jgi:hypothetical protein